MKLILCLIVAFVLIGCAVSTAPIKERMMPREKRIAYMETHGYKYSPDHQAAFIEAKVMLWFKRELIIALYGKPNKSFYDDTIWYYLNKYENTILKITFDAEGRLLEIKETPKGY